MVSDDATEITFLEIDPRLGANSFCSQVCGFHLPRIAVEPALRRTPRVGNETAPFPPGRRYAWTHGDLAGLKTEMAAVAMAWLANCLRSAVTADIYVTWRWSAPLPTLAIFAQPLVTRLKRLWPSR